MDQKSITDPLLWLYVKNIDENTTPEDLRNLLNVEEADDLELHMIKDQKPYAAIVKFKDAQSASDAINKLVANNEDPNGKEISVSLFVHVKYVIGKEKKNYKRFIERLREVFTHREDGDPEYLVEGEAGGASGTEYNPVVLGEQQRGQRPKRWIHIKLVAEKDGEESSTTTLVIRDDNLYVKGFTGKGGKWFELCEDTEQDGEKLPTAEYNATKLWGFRYANLMKLKNKEEIMATLESTKLGKAFAERAVRRLSRYCTVNRDGVEDDDDIPVRLGLAGLIVMIIESARFNPLLDYFAGKIDRWKNGEGLEKTTAAHIWNWKNMSVALLEWRDNKASRWNHQCGADSADTAKQHVHLVLKAKAIDISESNKAHVEILQVSVSANLEDVGEINVIDEKQKTQKIYAKSQPQRCCSSYCEQTRHDDSEGMTPLKAFVRGGISGYASFGIQVNCCPPNPKIMRWDWDCRKDDGGHQLVTRNITLGSASDDRRIRFTYLVMSNPIEATVKIEPWLPNYSIPIKGANNYYTACGTISAYISGFLEHPIVLFTSEKHMELEPWPWTFPLARSAVQVPQGKQLQIDMGDLHIRNSKEEVQFWCGSSRLSFDIEDSRPQIIFIDGGRGNGVRVIVEWKGKQNEPILTDIACEDIAGKAQFARCIDELRVELAKGCEGVLKQYKEGELPPDCTKDSHPVLTGEGQRRIHVRLQAELATTTLAIRDDKCYGVGFLNQSGVWYDLGNNDWGSVNHVAVLPEKYNSVLLDWGGVSYKHILGVDDWGEVEKKLDPVEKLGNGFARDAVRILSRYPDVEENESPRLALAGIILMVCESAKLNTVYNYFAVAGVDDDGSTLMNHIRDWDEISRALLYWRDHDYKSHKWRKHVQREMSTGTKSVLESLSDPLKDALPIVHLVFNYPRPQIDVEYTLEEGKEGFTAFIQRLRRKLAAHEHPEDVLDAHPAPVLSKTRDHPVLARRRAGQPGRWFHIILQLPDDEQTTSTTLAVRDDNVDVIGFMNQDGTWYGLDNPNDPVPLLPPEYKAERQGWGISFTGLAQGPRSEWVQKLESAELCSRPRDFATKAVRTLSQYHQQQEGGGGDDVFPDPRLALAGLILMVTESARFDAFLDSFAAAWDPDTETPPFSLQELMRYIDCRVYISYNLMCWKDDGYPPWRSGESVKRILGIESQEDALDAVALVQNMARA